MGIIKGKDDKPKAVEVIEKYEKEYYERHTEQENKISRLQELLGNAEKVRDEKAEAFKAAELNIDPEAMLSAKSDLDNAENIIKMYEAAIGRARQEAVFSREEVSDMQQNLKSSFDSYYEAACHEVGSLQVKKDHIVKDAMALYERGCDLMLCIVGDRSKFQPPLPMYLMNHINDINHDQMAWPQYVQDNKQE